MLKDNSGFFFIIASHGLPNKIVKETKIKEGEGNAGLAIKEKSAIFMKKIKLSKDTFENRYKTDSFISYPIEDCGEIVGLLNLTDKKYDVYLSEKDLEAIVPNRKDKICD
jgi:putative methionine-R-sulfoxide reductase with GAF domain